MIKKFYTYTKENGESSIVVHISDIFHHYKTKEDRLNELRRLFNNRIVDIKFYMYSESEMDEIPYEIKNMTVLNFTSDPHNGYEYQVIFKKGIGEVRKKDIYTIRGTVKHDRKYTKEDPYGEEEWDD